jgi:hypothetical protein
MVFRVWDPAGLRRRMGQLALLGGCTALGGSLLGLASGCGPSFEVLAEGDLRFVHCDRLDLDAKIAPSHRLHCWREWRRMYTYGQTRDRVEYAQRRIAEVVSGDTESPFQLPSGDSSGSAGRHWVRPGVKIDELAVPAAAAAAAASAAAAAAVTVPAAAGAVTPPAPSAEELACRNRCEAASAACSPGCETRPTGCKRCDQPLEACLGDCKPDVP